MLQNGLKPSADFPAILRPYPASPITEIARLGAKQMEERIAIALLIG